MFESLVFPTQALVVADRPENLGTEKTVALRLEGSVIDGLGLFDFSERPGPDHVRRGQTDSDVVKVFNLILPLQITNEIFHWATPRSECCGSMGASAGSRQPSVILVPTRY
jgi:hypothetical protein